MAAKNDITGDSIQTRDVSNAYRDNYDLIFGKKQKPENQDDQQLDNRDKDKKEEH